MGQFAFALAIQEATGCTLPLMEPLKWGFSMQGKPFLPLVAGFMLLFMGCGYTPSPDKVPYNGLTKTPPMGWSSWNRFGTGIDDQTVRTIADAMVSTGMRDAGYIYVNIDDSWQGARDAQGNLMPNDKFPDMKALADYIHSKGLKFGIYSSPGKKTCEGYLGSYGHETQDANTFASWGVDYLKYDWCYAGFEYNLFGGLQSAYLKMASALRATDRPMVYSLCEYGRGGVQAWGAGVGGNLWRTTTDINDSWDSMMTNIESQVSTAPYAGPGHWNDPDMLEIGNGGMTEDEYRTHMSLWALSAAPLLAGNDVRDMSASTMGILLNSDVIAIDQDPLGYQASPVRNGVLETWFKPLADSGIAVGIVNRNSYPLRVTVNLHNLAGMNVRDVWKQSEVLLKNDAYSATIPFHGTLLLKMSPN